jgi:hypothetical protein
MEEISPGVALDSAVEMVSDEVMAALVEAFPQIVAAKVAGWRPEARADAVAPAVRPATATRELRPADFGRQAAGEADPGASGGWEAPAVVHGLTEVGETASRADVLEVPEPGANHAAAGGQADSGEVFAAGVLRNSGEPVKALVASPRPGLARGGSRTILDGLASRAEDEETSGPHRDFPWTHNQRVPWIGSDRAPTSRADRSAPTSADLDQEGRAAGPARGMTMASGSVSRSIFAGYSHTESLTGAVRREFSVDDVPGTFIDNAQKAPSALSFASDADTRALVSYLNRNGPDGGSRRIFLDEFQSDAERAAQIVPQRIKIEAPWKDPIDGYVFFLNVDGIVDSGRDGHPAFILRDANGQQLEVSGKTFARLLGANRNFQGVLNRSITSVVVVSWNGGVPVDLAWEFANELRDQTHIPLPVFTATSTVVTDGVTLGLINGGHWQPAGSYPFEYHSIVAKEIATALSVQWKYAIPPGATGQIPDFVRMDDRHNSVLLISEALRYILHESTPGTLSLKTAGQLARLHEVPPIVWEVAAEAFSREPQYVQQITRIEDFFHDHNGEVQLIPLPGQFWDKIGIREGRATWEGRPVITEGTAVPEPLEIPLRASDDGLARVRMQTELIARFIAESLSATQDYEIYHADIVLRLPGSHQHTSGRPRTFDPRYISVAEAFRKLLKDATSRYLKQFGIRDAAAEEGAEFLVLKHRVVTEPTARVPQLKISVRSRPGMITEEFPWLSLINPHLDEDQAYRYNCIMSTIATDMSLGDDDHNYVETIGHSDIMHTEWLVNYAEGRPWYLVNDYMSIVNAMKNAPVNSRGILFTAQSHANAANHAWNIIRHERLGVVFLDGQHGDEWRPMQKPVAVYFAPMTEGVPPVQPGWEISGEELARVLRAMDHQAQARHRTAAPMEDIAGPLDSGSGASKPNSRRATIFDWEQTPQTSGRATSGDLPAPIDHWLDNRIQRVLTAGTEAAPDADAHQADATAASHGPVVRVVPQRADPESARPGTPEDASQAVGPGRERAGYAGFDPEPIADAKPQAADATGRRVNLSDLAGDDELDAIAERGGLASLGSVRAVASRVAAAFRHPADGSVGPSADVILTITIRADRTPGGIASSAQIVQAVAAELKHSVFMYLEEIGVKFKICW